MYGRGHGQRRVGSLFLMAEKARSVQIFVVDSHWKYDPLCALLRLHENGPYEEKSQ